MTDPITPDERAEWRALADAAHPGPWLVVRNHVRARGVGTHPGEKEASIFDDPRVGERDAEFIAAARTAVPRLLDALDTAEAEVARLRDTLARAWDEGFHSAEEQHDGYIGVSGWTNNNPYREEDRRD